MFQFVDMALFITHGLYSYECIFFNSDIVGVTCTLMLKLAVRFLCFSALPKSCCYFSDFYAFPKSSCNFFHVSNQNSSR